MKTIIMDIETKQAENIGDYIVTIIGKSLETALESAQLTDVKKFRYRGKIYLTEDYQVDSYVVTSIENDEIILFEDTNLTMCANFIGVNRSTLYRNKQADGSYTTKGYNVVCVTTISETALLRSEV